jgi:hypothetical protein
MRRISAIFLTLGVLAATGVWASGQGGNRLVSDRPCQDGWLGCWVDGELVNSDAFADSVGRLVPADLRIGFFDLKATPSFSVHGGLSTYGADEVPQIPEEVIEEPAAVESADTGNDAAAQQDGVAQVDPGPEKSEWQDPLFNGGENPVGYNGSNADAIGPLPEKEVVQVDERRKPPPRDPIADVSDLQDKDPDPPPVVSANCDDLRQLEGVALLGALSPAHSACLEERITTESSQTKKNKISRVLLINSESAKNGEWPRLMKRHLTNIDQSDPDMCFKYALHLSKKRGTSSAYGVIKWSEVALERKTRWSGPTFTKRVYDLHKLRAHAANKLWQRANEDLLNAGSNREELASKEEKARGRAKSLAREWLDFARAASQNTSEAMSLCVSTAGSKKFCKE